MTGADRTGSGNDEAYAYDANGNRQTANGDTYTTGANNQIASDGTYDYLYDAEGNRIRKTEIASGDYEEYEWDYRNRLIGVSFYDDSDVLQKRVEYAYDIFNRWVGKTVDTDGDTDVDRREAFVYDGINIVLRFAEATDDPLPVSSLANRYLWGPAVDQLLADEQIHWDTSDFVTDDLLWALTDHLGTVRDLATFDSGTDITTVQNHRTIDSFGNVTAETNSSFGSFILFTGKPHDFDTGLKNHWHRWYASANGVWMSEDPIGFSGNDSNLSRYGWNAVTSTTDPFGLWGYTEWRQTDGDGNLVPYHSPLATSRPAATTSQHVVAQFIGQRPLGTQFEVVDLSSWKSYPHKEGEVALLPLWTRGRFIEMGGSDKDLLEDIAFVLNSIHDSGNGYSDSFRRCYSWAMDPPSHPAPADPGPCQEWAARMEQRFKGHKFNKITWTSVSWQTSNPAVATIWSGHQAIRIEFIDAAGKLQIAYVDNGAIGGSYGIFFTEDIHSIYYSESPAQLIDGTDANSLR